MLYQLPSALADGFLDNDSVGLSRTDNTLSIIQIALAKAIKEFILVDFGLSRSLNRTFFRQLKQTAIDKNIIKHYFWNTTKIYYRKATQNRSRFCHLTEKKLHLFLYAASFPLFILYEKITL